MFKSLCSGTQGVLVHLIRSQVLWTYSYEPTQPYFSTRFHPSVGGLLLRLALGLAVTLLADWVCASPATHAVLTVLTAVITGFLSRLRGTEARGKKKKKLLPSRD